MLLRQTHRTDVVPLAEQLRVEDAVAVALEVVYVAAVHARAQTVGGTCVGREERGEKLKNQHIIAAFNFAQ